MIQQYDQNNHFAMAEDDSEAPASRAGECASEAYLKAFCGAVLDLAKSGSDAGSVLTQVLPSLLQAIGHCSHGAISQLQHDFTAWDKHSEQLGRLAVMHCGTDAEVLLAKLARTRLQAERVIEALQALQAACPPPPEFNRSRPAQGYAETQPAKPVSPLTAEIQYNSAAIPAELAELERAAALFEQARLHQQNKEYAQAEKRYAMALAIDPELRLAYLHRGRMWMALGRIEESIADFSRAVQLNPEDPLGYGWRADAQVLSGKFSEALADYDRALTLSPDLILLRYNRAVALRLGGHLDRAFAEFDRLVLIKPSHGPLYLNRGLIWLARDDLTRAAAEFRTALRYQPGSQEAIEHLREIDARLRGVAYEPGESRDAPDWAKVLLPLVDDLPVPATAEAERSAIPRRASKPARQNLPVLNPRKRDPSRKRRSRPQPAQHPVVRKPAVDVNAFSDGEIEQALTEEPAPPPNPVTEPAHPRSVVPAAAAPGSAVTTQISATQTAASAASAALRAAQGADEEDDDEFEKVTPVDEPANPAGLRDSQLAQMFSFGCPACGKVSLVPWNKLQVGKILSCPRCHRHFSTMPGGRIAEFEKDRTGKWKEQRQGFSRRTLYRLTMATAAMVFVTLGIAFGPGLLRGSPVEGADLPTELEPRIQAFSWAWLKSDYRTMRILSDPTQGAELFAWYQNNMPPEVINASNTIENDVIVTVQFTAGSAKDPVARVHVHLQGLQLASGETGQHQMPLAWEQVKETGWVFCPGDLSDGVGGMQNSSPPRTAPRDQARR